MMIQQEELPFQIILQVKYFNLKNLNKLSLEDGCATLSMLTAKSICMTLKSFKKKPETVNFINF